MVLGPLRSSSRLAGWSASSQVGGPLRDRAQVRTLGRIRYQKGTSTTCGFAIVLRTSNGAAKRIAAPHVTKPLKARTGEVGLRRLELIHQGSGYRAAMAIRDSNPTEKLRAWQLLVRVASSISSSCEQMHLAGVFWESDSPGPFGRAALSWYGWALMTRLLVEWCAPSDLAHLFLRSSTRRHVAICASFCSRNCLALATRVCTRWLVTR